MAKQYRRKITLGRWDVQWQSSLLTPGGLRDPILSEKKRKACKCKHPVGTMEVNIIYYKATFGRNIGILEDIIYVRKNPTIYHLGQKNRKQDS
jgi:hypothetical protein